MHSVVHPMGVVSTLIEHNHAFNLPSTRQAVLARERGGGGGSIYPLISISCRSGPKGGTPGTTLNPPLNFHFLSLSLSFIHGQKDAENPSYELST